MDIIVSDVIALGVIAFLSAMVLYFVSQKFKVEENPKIDEIEQILPGANCGACGKAGCRNFAEACVKADAEGFKNLYCPVGGASTMKKVADSLGFVATEKEETACPGRSLPPFSSIMSVRALRSAGTPPCMQQDSSIYNFVIRAAKVKSDSGAGSPV